MPKKTYSESEKSQNRIAEMAMRIRDPQDITFGLWKGKMPKNERNSYMEPRNLKEKSAMFLGRKIRHLRKLRGMPGDSGKTRTWWHRFGKVFGFAKKGGGVQR